MCVNLQFRNQSVCMSVCVSPLYCFGFFFFFFFFFFNDTATTEIYTLSLPDALPIYDADNRPLLVMRSNLWASGYDVDGTDQTS